MSVEEIIARAFQVLLALTGAYTVALWFALIVWTFRDIESRSRSVIAQIFSTLVVVLFFLPGVLIYLILRPKETLDDAFGRSLEEEYLLQDLEDLNLCATCRRPVREDFVVCPHCYTELRRDCPVCAQLVDLEWALCPYCTADLTQEPAEGDEQEAPWQEERSPVLPEPLRLLRQRTEVRMQHSLDVVEAGEAPRLEEGEQPRVLLTRETQETGSWVDDTGKHAWILTRAREVFRPLGSTETAAGPYSNGNGHHRHHDPDHAPADQGRDDTPSAPDEALREPLSQSPVEHEDAQPHGH